MKSLIGKDSIMPSLKNYNLEKRKRPVVRGKEKETRGRACPSKKHCEAARRRKEVGEEAFEEREQRPRLSSEGGDLIYHERGSRSDDVKRDRPWQSERGRKRMWSHVRKKEGGKRGVPPPSALRSGELFFPSLQRSS